MTPEAFARIAIPALIAPMACSSHQLRDQTIPVINQSAAAINTAVEGAELLYRIDQRATLAKAKAAGFTREQATEALDKRRKLWDPLWAAFDQAVDTHAEIKKLIHQDEIDPVLLGALLTRLTTEYERIAELAKARRSEIAGLN